MTMLMLCIFLAIIATAQAAPSAVMVGYTPGSDVTQHSLIDLDQKEMEVHLKKSPADFPAAKKIYELGANSGAYAEFTVAALPAAVAKGDTVTQAGNTAATGYVKSSAAAGATTLKVTYTSTCKMGGASSPITTGCFASTGNLNVGVPSALTNKYRTLAGFSTAAQGKMTGQEFYDPYKAYYVNGDYAHQYVMAALDGKSSLAGKPEVSRVECAKKGSAYMNVWMYVIREMEDAIEDCTSGCINCNDDPVHAWDEMVAFYAGSLEGTSGSTNGKLLYRLAEKRCANFGTCTGTNGKSAVNEGVVAQSILGKKALTEGRCADVPAIKKRIVQLMSVPLVQGALRYAYKVDKLQGSDKEIAEGAVFSAAILPRVAKCDSSAAKIISDNMKIDAAFSMLADFAIVKQAFESTYVCMGITCADVGGLVLAVENGVTKYYDLASPCVKAPPPGSTSSASGRYLSAAACLFGCFILGLVK